MATPPLDALTSLLALSFKVNLKVVVVDVKKAHLNGVVKPEGGKPLRPGTGGEKEAGKTSSGIMG